MSELPRYHIQGFLKAQPVDYDPRTRLPIAPAATLLRSPFRLSYEPRWQALPVSPGVCRCVGLSKRLDAHEGRAPSIMFLYVPGRHWTSAAGARTPAATRNFDGLVAPMVMPPMPMVPMTVANSDGASAGDASGGDANRRNASGPAATSEETEHDVPGALSTGGAAAGSKCLRPHTPVLWAASLAVIGRGDLGVSGNCRASEQVAVAAKLADAAARSG
jgi:hypothetical protein